MAKKKAQRKGYPKIPLFLIIFFLIISGLTGLIVLLLPTSDERVHLDHIHYEAFKRESPPPPPPRCKSPSLGPPPYSMPLVSIVIDDMGYHRSTDRMLIELPAPLGFSFLPYGPYTKKYARLAHSLGKDVLIHIPMEPMEKDVNPGPGTLKVQMSPGEIADIVAREISLVPYAIGANNHMGSYFTTQKDPMDAVLVELKRHGLFFLDSRTTKDTVAYTEARHLDVPALERHVFLDYARGVATVEHSLKRLVTISKKRGYAVAIGHPFKETLLVLKKDLPLVQKEVKIVPISHLIRLREEICRQ